LFILLFLIRKIFKLSFIEGCTSCLALFREKVKAHLNYHYFETCRYCC